MFFIRPIEYAAWNVVKEGWKALVDDKGVPKLRSTWTDVEVTKAAMNQKALNAIHSAVRIEMFALFSTCETAQEVWMILKNTFESNSHVKSHRLQQLTTNVLKDARR